MSGRFELERVGGPVSTEELLNDLKAVGQKLPDGVVTALGYDALGKFASSTLKKRFGSWNRAIDCAGLKSGNIQNYSDDASFANLMFVWESKERQPRIIEMDAPPSKISAKPYKRRFRTWNNALSEFVIFANAEELRASNAEPIVSKKLTPRSADLRLRFRVLKRDDFKCCACGKSPSAFPGLHLHVDHIVAWSDGGETILENLQTLCEPCNLGKSNVL